jgi:hypothetical protein
MKTFRIDDVSVNTDETKLTNMIEMLNGCFPHSVFLLGISPLVCDMSEYSDKRSERIFPSIFNAYSDHRMFYKVNKCGVPPIVDKLIKSYGSKIELAGHGLIHVDHRLLVKELQELSIIVSCNLIGAKSYIPPFNKWNKHTEEICNEHGINLIKFEDGWRHIQYEKIVSNFDRYYFHTHDFNIEDFKRLLG